MMRISQRIYRLLLKAYPDGYRRQYEAPMAQLFSDQLRAANTPIELIRLWLRTSVDLLRTLPVRHLEPHPRHGPFSRFNKSARRSFFFARYAAKGSGHAEITPEDILIGVLREDRGIRRLLPAEALQDIRHTLGSNPPQNRF